MYSKDCRPVFKPKEFSEVYIFFNIRIQDNQAGAFTSKGTYRLFASKKCAVLGYEDVDDWFRYCKNKCKLFESLLCMDIEAFTLLLACIYFDQATSTPLVLTL
jgi:hypothetical protein